MRPSDADTNVAPQALRNTGRPKKPAKGWFFIDKAIG